MGVVQSKNPWTVSRKWMFCGKGNGNGCFVEKDNLGTGLWNIATKNTFAFIFHLIKTCDIQILDKEIYLKVLIWGRAGIFSVLETACGRFKYLWRQFRNCNVRRIQSFDCSNTKSLNEKSNVEIFLSTNLRKKTHSSPRNIDINIHTKLMSTIKFQLSRTKDDIKRLQPWNFCCHYCKHRDPLV